MTNQEILSARKALHNRLYDINDMLCKIEDQINAFPKDRRLVARDSLACAKNRIVALDDMLEIERLERGRAKA